jgi:putative transposase
MRVEFVVTARMHTMTKGKDRRRLGDVKALVGEDGDFLRPLVQMVVQELLEAEMSEALAAEKGERTAGRLGYRSGYYGRTLVTRVGKLELRVPQDRAGRFSTELFERYQRSEKALVAALAQMYVQGCRPARSRRSPRSSVATAFRRQRSAPSTPGSTRS